jgi:hypothetical protein
LLIETEKTADRNTPHLIARDPLDMRNLETLRRLRQNGAPSSFTP